jgi:prepilin-type processing-associated H-X9-DG protein
MLLVVMASSTPYGQAPYTATKMLPPEVTVCPSTTRPIPSEGNTYNSKINYYGVPYAVYPSGQGSESRDRIMSRSIDIRNAAAWTNHNSRVTNVVLNQKKLSVASANFLFMETYNISYSDTEDACNWFCFNSKTEGGDARHNSRVNIVFSDGHAASCGVDFFKELKNAGHMLTENQSGYLISSATRTFQALQ